MGNGSSQCLISPAKKARYMRPDIVNVTLANGQKNAKSIRMEKGNLERLNKLGVTNDQIKEPW
jgi:hypothetical protein